MRSQNVAMYATCLCDPETRECLDAAVVNAILTQRGALVLAAVLTAPAVSVRGAVAAGGAAAGVRRRGAGHAGEPAG